MNQPAQAVERGRRRHRLPACGLQLSLDLLQRRRPLQVERLLRPAGDVLALRRQLAVGVLVPLLRAYPKYCLHEVLFASLVSLPLEEAYQQMREMRALTIRSVRRAVASLPSRLRAFGWQVRSIRGAGYLIEAIPTG